VPPQEFLTELGLLFRAAGRPSYRRISTEIRRNNGMPDTVSHETVGAILRGELARWSKVESVVRQLAVMAVHRPDVDDEVRRFLALWSDARDSQQPAPVSADRRRASTQEPSMPAALSSVSLTAPQPSGLRSPAPGPIGSAPQRNPSFVGRRGYLDQMATTLDAEPWRPLVLYGLGGVGKTQLAAEFLHRNAGRYDFVAWIAAEDPSQATAALAGLGDWLDWPALADMAQTVRGVLTRLDRGTPRWLIVYDNAGTLHH